jgi:hypothetical protein
MPIKKPREEAHLVRVEYGYNEFLVMTHENAQKLLQVLSESTYVRGKWHSETQKTIFRVCPPSDNFKVSVMDKNQLNEWQTEAALVPEDPQ